VYREYEGVRNVVGGSDLDIGNCGGECRKTLALRDYVWNPGVLDIGNLGGEGRKTLAPQGLRLESRVRISETSEVRVARLLHRRDYVLNPGQWIGHRSFRGGEDQGIVALRDYVCIPNFIFSGIFAEVRIKRSLHCEISRKVWSLGVQGCGHRLFCGRSSDFRFSGIFAEVRIKRSLHCEISRKVWSLGGYGYRFSGGGEDQEIVALLGLRLESRISDSRVFLRR
jgi:hypothetical protein